MKRYISRLCLVELGTLLCLLSSTPTKAQIVPDPTLPNSSKVTNQDNISTVAGGTQAGSNLFHSFEQFSLSTGKTAYFNNTPDIQNIFSRITGNSVSNIDGLIRANGTANLFLLNSNGIILGPNARLDIGGSFLASTASSIKFADDTQFKAKTPQGAPLLTISVPIGLEFGSNSGKVRVEGTGHNLSLGFSAIKRSSLTGLRVQPGKTLALVGGDVVLEGGNLIAEGGRIELGSVDSGSVSLSPKNTTEWTFGYERVINFRDVNLSQRALVDISGASGGSIQVQGANVRLMNGSVILSQNQGSQPAGSLKVNASESLELSGTSSEGSIPSILRTETVGTGDGGDIGISTKRLLVQGGTGISSRTYSTAKGGDLTVNGSESIQLLGFSPFNPLITSNISASTSAYGNAGNIKVSTGRLVLQDGGTVSSLTRGAGSGGKVIVDATNSVELITSFELINSGLNYGPTVLSATAFNLGDAGSLEINTSRFVVGDGTLVNTSTLGSRSAGSITINASTSVEVSGAIGSSAIKADETTQKLFAAPPMPSGASGNVTINTGRLSLTDGGRLSVRNQGSSSAGTITINARSIFLDDKGSITAETASGEGGKINLQAQDLQLRHNSAITATAGKAGGRGNGGNIRINTDLLTALENSDITANAFKGQGGNIQINTQAIFRSPDSNITASSKLGINGTVQINTPSTEPSYGLVAVPEEAIDVSRLVTQGCLGSRGNLGRGESEFIITGRGGLPPQPGEPLRAEAIVVNNNTLSAAKEQRSTRVNATPTVRSTPTQLVETQGWVLNDQGEVVLTVQPPSATPNSSGSTQATCYAP